jgi:hypothetical protein
VTPKQRAFLNSLRDLERVFPYVEGFDAWAIKANSTYGHAIRNARSPYGTLESLAAVGKVDRIGNAGMPLWRTPEHFGWQRDQREASLKRARIEDERERLRGRNWSS